MKKIYKIIYKFFARRASSKKKKTLLLINDYLEKFNYTIDTDASNINNSEANYIWQFWNEGEEKAPAIVKKCFRSVKKFNPDKKIIILDDTIIEKYIKIPSFIKEKYHKGIIRNAHYSDYIRTCLLVKYGGLWIDATVLLTDKIPNKILNQDFFVFKNPIWYSYKTVPSENLFKVFLSVEQDAGLYGSNWFIASKPNNILLNLQKNLLEQYWSTENSLIYYFLYHLLISKSIIKNTQCKKLFEKMHSLSNKGPHILQNVLQDKYDPNLLNAIKQISFIHKLTYKFNKVNKNSFLEYILQGEKI